ncbi:NADP-dependent oxidoreductase [Chitinophaga sp. Hz27]|uniref:NADP-dependent oxidoreductase n=1 Tax=Chitinophaga sp. Hz27 TaxID=3347169 RepID=UPI0035E07121
MKAVILKDFGEIDNLVLADIPVPEIATGEVLVKVNTLSITPVDVKTRAGGGVAKFLKDIHPIILGWDISGTVTESKSSAFKTGDAVFGMVNFLGHGKAYAEYVAVPADQLALKPDIISHEEAAAATLAALTAWQALAAASIQPGHKVHIHAAAGGVGHYAVQIAKQLGAYVIGTSSARNKELLQQLGVDQHIDYTTQPLKAQVSDLDFVLDTLGGDNITTSLQVIKPGGTLISLPGASEAIIADKSKGYPVNASYIRVQSNGKDMQQIASWLAEGKLKSIIAAVFPFKEIGKAHLQIESGRTAGKVVVKLDERI